MSRKFNEPAYASITHFSYGTYCSKTHTFKRHIIYYYIRYTLFVRHVLLYIRKTHAFIRHTEGHTHTHTL